MNDERQEGTDDGKLERVWGMLDRWEAPDPPPDFRSRVLARTTGTKTAGAAGRRPGWRWNWKAWSLTAAAAGLAAVLLVGRVGQEEPVPLAQTRVAEEAGNSPGAPEIELLENLEVLEAMGDIEPVDEMFSADEAGEHSQRDSAGFHRVKV
jgi:hypothetical protein